ncbi:MAG: CC0125/CC1285 family lipoprotein [Phenylobacterium sp.]|uniref:CC0125/CC1285 family lipoprotein n=1 Tax=Phenylobacterium sp. TaxID=1871053 RepID=UPI00391D218D
MSRKFAVIPALLAVSALLAACATATPYQPNLPGQKVKGGYSEVRLEPDRYRVTFQGNSLTSRETVEGSLLYRAAELTVAQGYDWFSVVDRNTDRKARTYIEPDPFYHPWYGPYYPYWSPSWRYYGPGYGWRTWDPWWGDPFWADRVDVRTVERFEATAEIQMRKGAKPEGDARAFDARAVMENLGPRLQRPAPGA